MTRLSSVQVIVVTNDEQERLIPLWVALRAETGQTQQWAQRAARDGRIEAAIARSDVRIFLASVEDADAGFAVVTRSPLSGLGDEQAAWIDQMWVSPEHRGAGVARALLAKVSAFAEERGSTQLVCCVPAQSRAVNRYFARLGFTGVVTARATSTAALRRRLTGATETSGAATVRMRRSLRARSRDDVNVVGGL